MFYGYDGDVCRPGGQISDYRLDTVIKAKSINFYVPDVPLILDEAIKQNALIMALPKGFPYGVRTRVWSDFFPNTAFLGEMVSYSIYNETGGAVEVMIPYADFVMASVPWDDIIA
ncbi:hypothetical protein QGX17_gp011 [Pseudomonas phage phiPsa381]|uniref:Uncharacterized protein n=2 Tax=Otagovirus TaxID=2560197 RepID=A0A7G9V2Y0_9CAUD|nr:hypothetical protein QGX16_gp012 [Pseudomonas phage phiPsa397]YP_010767274.1 hypothetical protein QGX17_gp011 [Pseudomonas phage phiPsa381]QNO00636.1 hypothetical protein phiPsa381_011 [Pseudomonas phage phiPsa381]QNO00811.1 hypothetical protein phiPsa397_012 [Pseudomonas phage phiPsa397]